MDLGGGLKQYGEIGGVCACFDNANEESIKRLIKTVEGLGARNKRMLKGKNYTEAIKQSSCTSSLPPHILLVIDNVNVLLDNERFGFVTEKIELFCRDGLSYGLTVVFTANDLRGTSKMRSFIKTLVAFELTSDFYDDLFSRRISKPIPIQGRGLIGNNSNVYEFQSYLPFACVPINDHLAEEREVQSIIETTKSHKSTVERLFSFPDDAITAQNWREYTSSSTNIVSRFPLCVTYDTHEPIAIKVTNDGYYSVTANETDCRVTAIYGKLHFGKTNLLKLMVDSISEYFVNHNLRLHYKIVDDVTQQLRFMTPNEKSDKTYEKNGIMYEQLSKEEFLTILKSFKSSSMPVARQETDTENEFTVYILQAKWLWHLNSDTEGEKLLRMINNAADDNSMFIFSDAKPPVTDTNSYQHMLNSSITMCFLLDDLWNFVSVRGKHTVLMDYVNEIGMEEMKRMYAPCELGDGFVFDTIQSKLEKVRFLHSEPQED